MANTTGRFAVAIHYGDDETGYLVYNEEGEKDVRVVLPDEAMADKVVAFLKQELTIQDAVGLNEYEERTIDPLDSVDNLKLTLTRLWEYTDVQVDWSRPIDAFYI